MNKDKGKPFRVSVTDASFIKYIHDALEAINTPRSLMLSILLRDDPTEAVRREVRPIEYCDADSYFADAQALALIKKNPWIKTDIDKKAVALEKFLLAEAKCKETNSYLTGRLYVGKTNLAGYLYHAKNFIQRVLGSKFSSFNPGFGPGATTACRGLSSTMVDKLRTPPHCTLEARNLVVAVTRSCNIRYSITSGLYQTYYPNELPNIAKLCIERGNQFTTVPKDCRSDRGICIEPHGNMFVQKGFGDLIRRRLKRCGYDLDNLPNLHKQLALESSLNDCFATIDLASASDTIATALVKELLPPEWFDLLNSVRSKETKLDKETWVRNEKFSSMGNGFTFELETLIFLALCQAVSILHGNPKEDIMSVFGDDIIVPKRLASPLISVLSECGFSINTEKTFVDGPFKESCGGDFFNGVDVRPVFIKELPNHGIEKCYTFANRIRQIAKKFSRSFGCDSRFKPLWLRIVGNIPRQFRYYGPDEILGRESAGLVGFFDGSNLSYRRLTRQEVLSTSLGDRVLISDRQSCSHIRVQQGCLRVSYLERVSRSRPFMDEDPYLALTCALSGLPSEGVTPRGASYTITKRHTHVQWDEWSYTWV